ncbi:hypothetical protein WJX74_002258 [Apatococcus lobatus]|uniref:Uncharacterized protein n=1 Tax=Apatococcus lobatus TaxID=904363 RepID=A0AAW1QIC0_9CHLO
MGKDFLLLKSGPGPQEEPSAGGDLLKYHQITPGFYQRATLLKPGNYLKSLPGDVSWYRGDKCDLEPLANLLPAQSDAVGWKPTRVELQAFKLEPGTFALDKADLGQAVDTHLAPLEGQDMGKMQTAAPEGAPQVEKAKKEKKHKKEKKEKKEKKRQRSG